MREVLYRGKDIKTGEWHKGYYVFSPSGSHVIGVHTEIPPIWNEPGGDCRVEWYEIDPSTIGQYTGRDDRNGVKIFEGDIYVTERGNERVVYYSKDDSQFKARSKNKNTWGDYDSDHCMHNPLEFGVRVFGNIHDEASK